MVDDLFVGRVSSRCDGGAEGLSIASGASALLGVA